MEFMAFSFFKKNKGLDKLAIHEIDTSPQAEEPQKINKGILYVVIFLIAAVMGYSLLSGGDKKKNDTEERAVVTQQEILPDDKLAEIERQEREKSGKGLNKPGANPADLQKSDANVPAQQANYTSTQPQPIVPSNPQDSIMAEAEMRRREKVEKREDEREKEAREGQRSGIFFTLSKDKDKKDHKTQAENINDYYNNQGYIEIVGGATR